MTRSMASCETCVSWHSNDRRPAFKSASVNGTRTLNSSARGITNASLTAHTRSGDKNRCRNNRADDETHASSPSSTICRPPILLPSREGPVLLRTLDDGVEVLSQQVTPSNQVHR